MVHQRKRSGRLYVKSFSYMYDYTQTNQPKLGVDSRA